MALLTTAVGEIRSAGSDNSSGFFDSTGSGTDYSQQDAAQYSASDLTVDAVTNTKVTSASHSFVAADVGNYLRITGGGGPWNANWYKIDSVAGGAATLHSSPAAVGSMGGVYVVGGALATPGQAGAAIAQAAVGGVTLHCKGATYTMNATPNVAGGCLSFATSSSNDAAPNRLFGYQATRLDAGTPPIWQPSANTTDLIALSTAGNIIDNIAFAANSKTGIRGLKTTAGATRTQIRRCKATSLSGNAFEVGAQTVFWKCSSDACTGANAAFYANSADGVFFDECTASNGSAIGFYWSVANGGGASRCLAVNITGDGFNVTTNSRGIVLLDNTASGNSSTDFNIVGTAHERNNRAWSTGTYGFRNSNGTPNIDATLLVNCASGGHGTADFQANTMTQIGSITLTVDPSTNAAGGDFSLNNTAGGGAACRAAGEPGTYPGNVSTVGYANIGGIDPSIVAAAVGAIFSRLQVGH